MLGLRLGKLLLVGLLVLSCPRAHGALPSALVKRVRAIQAQAEALSLRGKSSEALQRLDDARKLIRSEALRGGRKPAVDPKLIAGQKALQEKYRKLAAAAGPEERQRLVKRYALERKMLLEKHRGARRPVRTSDDFARQGAEARLLMAELDDQAATVYRRAKRPEGEAGSRQAALTARLGAYQALGKIPLAEQAAAKLLALPHRDPDAYAAAGEFFQERGDFGRAARIWQDGIAAVQSGAVKPRAPEGSPTAQRLKTGRLVTFYRQLAYCQQRLGRGGDATRSLQQAARLEGAQR